MVIKKLLMLIAIISGFSFLTDIGNCTDNPEKKPIFKIIKSNNTNNNKNNIKRPIFTVTHYNDDSEISGFSPKFYIDSDFWIDFQQYYNLSNKEMEKILSDLLNQE